MFKSASYTSGLLTKSNGDEAKLRRVFTALVTSIFVVSLLLVSVPVDAQAPQRSMLNSGFEEHFLVPPAPASANNFFAEPGGRGTYSDQSWVVGWLTNHPTQSGACLGMDCKPIEMWNSPFQNISADAGQIMIELNAYVPSRVYQNICITNGEAFSWRFSHRGRPGSNTTGSDVAQFVIGGSALGSGTQIVRVSTPVTGSLGHIVSGSGTAVAGINGWTRYSGTYTFTGTTGTEQLGFEAVSSSVGEDSYGNLLDHIQIGLNPYLEFSAASYQDNEGNGGNIPAVRISGVVSSPLSVDIQVTGGTATAGQDFTFTTPLVIPAGTYTAHLFPIDLTIHDRTDPESDETIVLTISPGGVNYTVASTVTCGAVANNVATYTIVDEDSPPGGVGAGLVLWLDADDPDADGAATNNPHDGGSVGTWKDKSGTYSDVSRVDSAHGIPTYLTQQFNGKPAMDFSKSESDTLRHVLGTPWTSDYTEFIVFELQGNTSNYDSFFSNGSQDNSTYHQINSLSGNFQWYNTTTQVVIEPPANDLKLFAVRGDSSGTEVFSNGNSKNTNPETGGRTFAQYRINQDRGGNRFSNSKIAETIVYNRALDDCELEQVSAYLGIKYGQDFNALASHYNVTDAASYSEDINGIAKYPSACTGGQTFNSAVSDIVTIDNPDHLVTGEFLLIGHDGGGLSTSLDVPGVFDARLTQIWRADADEANGMAVSVHFDTSTAGGSVDLSDPAQLALLISTDSTMADATLHASGATVNGNIVTFTGVTFAHDVYFTLAHHVPPGLYVHNPGPVDYHSLTTPVVVAPNLIVTFNNPTTIDIAKVDIAENYHNGADVLGIAGQTGTSGTVNGLSWSWDHTRGVLTLTGSANEATYQSALRQVTFSNTSGTPTTTQRKLTYSLGKGLQNPGNGHLYEYLPSSGITWDDAKAAAASRIYFGLQGYLTTITSLGESEFILGKLSGKAAWIAARSADEAGTLRWRWKTGPEGLEEGGLGRTFWEGGTSGQPVNGAFSNWISGVTPNNGANKVVWFINVGCTFTSCAPSKWDDVGTTNNMPGYVVEYGGRPGDPALHLADNAFVNILAPALVLTKTALPTPDVTINTNLVYTLSYQNTGNGDALNVVLHDTIPAGATYVSHTGGGSFAGNTVTWNLGTLAVGASGSVTVTVTAPSTTGAMTNSATLDAQNAPAIQATSTVTVVGPTLALQKTGPARVGISAPVTYRLTYSNTGNQAASNTVLADVIPIGSTFVSATGGGNCIDSTAAACAGPSDGTHTVYWTLGSLSPGSISVDLVITAPGTIGTIVNSATLSANAPATDALASVSTHVSTCEPNNAFLNLGELSNEVPAAPISYPAFSAHNDTPVDINYTVSNIVGTPLFGPAPYSPGSPWAPSDHSAMATDNPDNGGITIRTAFSTPVYGLKFNVSDLDQTGEIIEIRLYDGTGTLIPPGSITVRTQAAFVLDENLTSMSYGTQVQPATASNGGRAFENSVNGEATSNDTAVFVQVAYTQPITAFEVDASQDGTGVWITVPYFNLPCMTKTFLPGTIDALTETSSLKIQLDNAIDGLLHNVAFTDTLPDGLVLNSAPPGAQCGGTVSGTIDGSVLTLGGGQLGPGQQTCSILATVKGITSGAKVNDRSRISAITGLDRTGVNASVVVTKPVLSLTKTATPTSVVVNGTITYSLQYTNIGSGAALGAQLVDPIAAIATYVSSTGGGVFAGGNVTWNLGDLAVGATGTVSVVVTAPGFPLTLNNLATLSADNVDLDAQDSAAVTVFGEPLFSLAIADFPDPVPDGTDLHYTLTLTNTGTIPATGTILTMLIPADTTFVSASGGGTLAGGVVTWNLGTLAVGQPTSVVLTVNVDAPLPDGTLIHASATADAGNLATPVVATAQTTVTSKPDLDVILTATPTNVQGGDTITYNLVWSNYGTALAAGTVLTFTAPGSTTITASSGTSTVTGPVVTWNIGNLLIGQTGSYSVTVRVDSGVPDGLVLTGVASLTSSTNCGTTATPCSDTDDAVSIVGTASVLDLTKTAPAFVGAGGSVTYELHYTNTGNLDAQNMIISDVLPAHTIFVSASAGGVCLDGQSPPGSCVGVTDGTYRVVWNLGTLGLGTSGTVHLTVGVEDPLADGTAIVNTASLESTDAGGPHPASAQTTTHVTSSPALTLLKSGPPRVSAGLKLTYTLAYANIGTDEATNVILTDHFPTGTTFYSATGGGTEQGGVVTWDLGTLPAGTSGSVILVLDVDSQLVTGTLLTNNSTLSGTGTSTISSQSSTTWIVNAPLPILAKTPTPASVVAAGQPVTYVLDFRNDGNRDMVNGVLTDHVPLGLVPTVIGGGGTYDAGTGFITWPLGGFAAQASGSVTFSILVPLNTPNGSLVSNTATLEADNMSALTVAQHLVVTSAPVLELTKDAPLFTDAGGSVTYTLHFQNTGNVTAFNAVLTDILPPETTFALATGAYSHVAGTVTWTLGDLAPGAGGSVIIVATVQNPIADGTVLANTASLTAGNSQPTGTIAFTTVLSKAHLILSKAAQAQVAAGGQILYTLAYQNIGTDQATNVVLTDNLPAHTTFVSATGGGTHAGGVVTWNLGILPAGAGATVNVLVDVDPVLPNGILLVNSAGIQSTTTAPVGAVAGTAVVSAPIFSLTKTASPGSLVQAGQQILYTISYRNDGNEDSLNTILTDLVPTNVAHPPDTFSTNGGPGAWDAGTGLITWNFGTVPVGGSGTETVTVTVPIATPDGTLIVNSATLTGDDAAPASTQIPLLVGANAVLLFSKTADTAVAIPGDTVIFTIEYQNIGNGLATGAVIVDTVPSFMNFISASNSGVWNSGAGTVTWTLPDIAPGSGGILTLIMAVDTVNPPINGTTLTNSATFDTNETQPSSASAPITIAAPVLTLVMSSSPEPVSAGQMLTYTLDYSNTGTTAATSVTIIDSLSGDMIFVGLTGNGNYDAPSHSVTWNLADIPPGGSGSLTLFVEIVSPLADGTLIYNSASINSTGTAPVVAQVVNTVLSAPQLTLTKVGSPNPVRPGELLTYTITVENIGNEDATSVVIRDDLPLIGISFVSADFAGVYDSASHSVTWNLGTVPAGTGPISVTLVVSVNLASGEIFTNTVEVSSTETPPLAVTEETTVLSTVAIPDLSWIGRLMLILMLAVLGRFYLKR